MKTRVQVLLSSYNGAGYLREQLDSILNQKEIETEMLIRDDGSTDGTLSILSEYEQRYQNVTVEYGENIGAVRSFFRLIASASEGTPYIAFSDQDDVWLPDKLERAAAMISRAERANPSARIVYCSDKQLVDKNLQPIRSAITYGRVKTAFGNALVENMCTGCTCVINKEMLCLLKGREPEFAIMHDFWIYLTGTCFGTVIYDEESRILYRQHEKNQLGAASSKIENYRRRIRNYSRHRGQLKKQAEELLRIYGKDMPEKHRFLAEEFVKSGENRAVRRKILKERCIFRQKKSDTLIMRILLRQGIL